MKKFKKIYIEITNVCNLSCDFCPKTSRSAQFMTRELFHDILKQIDGNAKYLYFHVMGEPLLHPELGSFLDLAGKDGYRVSITTNGTLIESVSDLLISTPALRQVNFSLHSFDANNLDYPLDVYLDKIFQFIRKVTFGEDRPDVTRPKQGISVALRLWNLQESGNRGNNRYVLDRLQKEFDIEGKLEEQLTTVMGVRLRENVFLNQASRFEWPSLKGEDAGSAGSCYGLRDQIAILVDGSVVPCCLDGDGTMVLGNIQKQNLEDILNTPRARAICTGFSERRIVEPLCRKCGYRNRFR